ncbi:MAG: hypothetical protein L0Y64_23560, partial [Myxococcaceae bacterium]|nr:hypothetical protein [Myxococcaceae bacterium]
VPDLLTVQYPASVLWPGSAREDERASAFFIYSLKDRKPVLSTFGHPEWAPVDKSVILTVRPFVFFTIGSDPRVYFLGEHGRGWESNGFAIYDLRSGRAMLESF